MENYRSFPSARSRAEVVNAFMRGVYGWMTAGLGVTAAVAMFVASSRTMVEAVFGNPVLLIGLVLAQLGIVIALSAAIQRLSGGAATALFIVYSALTGVTLSSVLLAFTGASVAKAFVVCAGMFGAMSVYGLTTKKDLTSMGSFMFMGLIGILLASVVNMFVKSSAMDFVISVIGVIVFTGLTAYDTQVLKDMGEAVPGDDATAVRRGTILGALRLYLDFINLFLMLVRLFGSSRD